MDEENSRISEPTCARKGSEAAVVIAGLLLRRGVDDLVCLALEVGYEDTGLGAGDKLPEVVALLAL